MAQRQVKYHDHSGESQGHSLLQMPMKRNDSVPKCKGGDNPFPVKLHYALAEIEKDGLSYIVSWQPHGRCVVVHNHDEFVKRILPYWFRQSKFTSFQRQLNLYGFRRITTGLDKGGYYHELFLRGKPDLATRIERKTIKGTGTRKPSSPETEPNFYAMDYLPKRRCNMVTSNCPAPMNLRTILQQTLPRSYESHLPPSLNNLDARVLATQKSRTPTYLQESLIAASFGRVNVANKNNSLIIYNEIMLSQLPHNEGSNSVIPTLPTSI